jgi:exopolyphosphatase/guanosine-5'-triphosphate,3'-diphosphate pyrophosphatase
MDFIEAVYRETGIRVEIISGEMEAEYIYLGVRTALDMGMENSLVMDIGGGSVEFIIADKNRIKWSFSFNLGAARLLETFKPSDPISQEEIFMVENYLEKNLGKLFAECEKYKPEVLIGSSGSFDTFAEMIANEYYSPEILENKTEYVFDMEEYEKIHRILIASNREERAQMKGIIPMRVDMIVLASIFVNFIIKKLDIHEMKLSTHALKEGILWSVLEK